MGCLENILFVLCFYLYNHINWLVKELGNFFLKIALAKVTNKIGQGNYFLLILC